MSPHDPASVAARARRVELILQELDALPTLSGIAVKLLELTADAESETREIIELITLDPSLASRVIAMCRCHERGRAADVTTVERAVVLLGFDAIRSAVLAVQVFDMLERSQTPFGEVIGPDPTFDREAFWLHSIAVAVMSQKIAARGPKGAAASGEAFMAGLLHDIGQLVLHVLMPQSFDRVCRMAETHAAPLDHACRQVIGVDSHTAGRRLAEHWGLPSALTETIWLNGQSFEALPRTQHRTLIATVTLADAIVRSQYITAGAQYSRLEEIPGLAMPLGLSPQQVSDLAENLHDEVSRRAAALGLDLQTEPQILMRAISRANRSLARVNSGMRQRDQVARQSTKLVRAICDFLGDASPGAPMLDILSAVARSVHRTFGTSVRAAVFDASGEDIHQIVRFTEDHRPFRLRSVQVPDGSMSPEQMLKEIRSCVPLSVTMPWLPVLIEERDDNASLRVLPLAAPQGGGALLILDGVPEELTLGDNYAGLLRSWIFALAGGAQQDEAGHIAEQLAEANRSIRDMHDMLARTRTMATLGEVAAGAAHEMNNPLTIISGRAQVLAARTPEGDLQKSAREISDQAKRLSEMISALRSFAEPVVPQPAETDLAELIVRTVQRYGPGERRQPAVGTTFGDGLAPAWIDPDLISQALGELVRNAVESRGARHIELRVHIDPVDDRLRVEVRDDGSGLSDHALQHAFDPFFSDKPAGRQPGLGLSRAVRFVEAHGGRITLVNAPVGGAVATIWLDQWRVDSDAARSPEEVTSNHEA